MAHPEQLSSTGSSDEHRGRAKTIRAIAGIGSLLVMSALIVTTSQAAFTASTDNTTNSFATGSIALVDDDVANALFSVTNAGPGDSATSCINVTYNGTIDPDLVKFYASGYTESVVDFGDFINVKIDEGSGAAGGPTTSCTGFVSDDGGTLEYDGTLPLMPTAYAGGAGTWDPNNTGPGQVKSYEVTLELDASATNAEQNESITLLTLTWEVQS